MTNWLDRTELLLGEENILKLQNANVLVVGLGGVGAYAAEQLCRAGIGKMTIVDGDTVELTNLNRQLPALHSTVGRFKAEILSERFRDINPEIRLTAINEFIHNEKTVALLTSQLFDYVVDAIDTLSPKVFLAYHAVRHGLKVVSSMGAGGKMEPGKVQIADISKSYNCRLARMFRKRLSRFGITTGVKVVFSSEEIIKESIRLDEGKNKKSTVGTVSYMPPVFGCFIANVVVCDLIDM